MVMGFCARKRPTLFYLLLNFGFDFCHVERHALRFISADRGENLESEMRLWDTSRVDAKRVVTSRYTALSRLILPGQTGVPRAPMWRRCRACRSEGLTSGLAGLLSLGQMATAATLGAAGRLPVTSEGLAVSLRWTRRAQGQLCPHGDTARQSRDPACLMRLGPHRATPRAIRALRADISSARGLDVCYSGPEL